MAQPAGIMRGEPRRRLHTRIGRQGKPAAYGIVYALIQFQRALHPGVRHGEAVVGEKKDLRPGSPGPVVYSRAELRPGGLVGNKLRAREHFPPQRVPLGAHIEDIGVNRMSVYDHGVQQRVKARLDGGLGRFYALHRQGLGADKIRELVLSAGAGCDAAAYIAVIHQRVAAGGGDILQLDSGGLDQHALGA